MEDEGAKALAAYLASPSCTLVFLDVSLNEGLSDIGVARLLKVCDVVVHPEVR